MPRDSTQTPGGSLVSRPTHTERDEPHASLRHPDLRSLMSQRVAAAQFDGATSVGGPPRVSAAAGHCRLPTGLDAALRRYVAVGVTEGAAECLRSLIAGEAWAKDRGLQLHPRVSVRSGAELLDALRVSQLGEGDLLHIETHGAWEPDGSWGFWFGRGSEVFSPGAPAAPAVGPFCPSLVLIGACKAATPGARGSLNALFGPGVPVIACHGRATSKHLISRVFPSLTAAHAVQNGPPRPGTEEYRDLQSALAGRKMSRTVQWQLVSAGS